MIRLRQFITSPAILAIGGVLALLALIALGGSLGGGHSPDLRVKATIKGLEIAIKSYKTEYQRLPRIGTTDVFPIQSRGRLVAVLLGEDTAENPREIRFFDPPPFKPHNRSGAARNSEGEWELRDHWGHFYRIHLDFDGDGRILNPAKGALRKQPDVLTADVIIYSAGKDGDYATWEDNILSWR